MKLNDMLKKAEKKLPNNDPLDKEINAPWQTTSITHNNPDYELKEKTEVIKYISPEKIRNWEYSDRIDSELGSIEDLALDLQKVGQQQPCVVRNIINEKYDYELIIGERRWRAAKLANIDLMVIIKSSMSDEDAALSQAAENDNRVDLSDYAKGISFSKLVNNKKIKQKDLIIKLGKSKQYVSALLSYSKIPEQISNAIGDMSKVKYFSAEKIKQLSQKGDEYINALIKISDKIRDRSLSAKMIEKEVKKIIDGSKEECLIANEKIYSSDGRHLFTWRHDNNNLPSLHFPKQIISLINDKKISKKELTKNLIKNIEGLIEDIKKQKSD